MSIQRLLESIQLLIELHEKLLEAAESKTQAIVNNNLSEITLTMSKESRILKEIEKQEAVRETVGHELMQEKGIKSRLELTVSELSRLVFDPEDKSRLLAARKELVTLLGKLKEVNELNQLLISQSLSFVDYSLNLFIGGDEDEAVYKRPDTQSTAARGPQRNGIFDARA
ncbi:flagellar protein FlgN [Paenibacillus sp. FSL H7-0714]|uniref:flagellar protein FlgN n=1 Tax=Paenibacillus sp. FSL H7-0714 TaxID=2954735 RepID=UPI0030F4E6C0